MSQFFVKTDTGSGPVPPDVPTSFVTQSGTAIPAGNILIVNAYDTSENNDNGIETKGGVAGGDPPGTGVSNEVDIYLTNRVTGTVTTTDATLTTIITLPLGAIPGTVYVYGNVQAFEASTPSSGAYSYTGGYRTSGAAATELGVELHDEFEDAALVTADIFISASANNVIVQVQGVVGLTINWRALLEYRVVS